MRTLLELLGDGMCAHASSRFGTSTTPAGFLG
jgi:hypothetical protein